MINKSIPKMLTYSSIVKMFNTTMPRMQKPTVTLGSLEHV